MPSTGTMSPSKVLIFLTMGVEVGNLVDAMVVAIRAAGVLSQDVGVGVPTPMFAMIATQVTISNT